MGKVMRSKEARDGIGLVTDREPMGVDGEMLPPSVTRGERRKFEGGERNRINLSLPEGVYQALDGMATKLGMPLAQVALASLMAGLPAVAAQLDACVRLSRDEAW